MQMNDMFWKIYFNNFSLKAFFLKFLGVSVSTPVGFEGFAVRTGE